MPRGQWALWRDVPEPARGELRGFYRDLRNKYRPRGHLRRAGVKLVAELVFTTAATSEAAVLAVVKRDQGKGRRPNVRQVNQALKRQGLQLGSLNQMLPGGLAELLAGRNGQPLDLARAIQQAQEAGR